MKTVISSTTERGRGVFATEEIRTGNIIETAELIELTQKATKDIDKTALNVYTYRLTDDQDCLVLGNGELFNHSSSPNVSYIIVKRSNRRMMQFKAIKDIYPGDELLIDYKQDIAHLDLSKYTIKGD